MGQKVHPTGIRLGITKDHSSVWYAERGDYADKLFDDIKKYFDTNLQMNKNRSNNSQKVIRLRSFRLILII